MKVDALLLEYVLLPDYLLSVSNSLILQILYNSKLENWKHYSNNKTYSKNLKSTLLSMYTYPYHSLWYRYTYLSVPAVWIKRNGFNFYVTAVSFMTRVYDMSLKSYFLTIFWSFKLQKFFENNLLLQCSTIKLVYFSGY